MKDVPENYPSTSKCDNCEKIWPDGKLKEAEDLSERLDPGGMNIPTGECPDCGALCYTHDDGKGYDLKIRVRSGDRAGLLASLDAIRADLAAESNMYNFVNPKEGPEWEYGIHGVPIAEGADG